MTASRQASVIVAADGSFEQRFLSTMLVLLFVTYASLGKNVFLNGNDLVLVVDDPISRNIGYVRVLVCFTSVVYIVLRHGPQDIFRSHAIAFAPFVGWAVLSSVWADDHWTAFRSSSYLVIITIALPPIIYRLGLLTTVCVVLHTLAVVMILSAFFAILLPHIGRHTSTDMWAAQAGRWRGIFAHKNALGPWAAFGSVFLFTYSWIARGPRLYWWAARISALLCLVFAGSAMSVVAFVFMIAGYMSFRLRRNLSDSVYTLSVVVGVLVAFIGYSLFKSEVFAALGRDETFTGRTDIWVLALSHIAVNPWFGSGYLTTGGPEFLAEIFAIFLQEIPGAENAYLTLTLELGIVGLVLFYGPVLNSARKGMQWWHVVDAEHRAVLEMLLLIIATALVIGFTESTPFICTGYDGVMTFPAVFGLAMLPSLASIRGGQAHQRSRPGLMATRA